MKTVETTRGVISFFAGSVPRARMASICSVTTIEPSSLAIPDEFLPATIRPVNTGPNSRTMPTETNWPSRESEPNRCSVVIVVQSQNRPGEESSQDDDGQRSHANKVGLLQHVGKIARMAEQVGDGLSSQKGVILHDLDSFFGEFRRRDQFHAIQESCGRDSRTIAEAKKAFSSAVSESMEDGRGRPASTIILWSFS